MTLSEPLITPNGGWSLTSCSTDRAKGEVAQPPPLNMPLHVRKPEPLFDSRKRLIADPQRLQPMFKSSIIYIDCSKITQSHHSYIWSAGSSACCFCTRLYSMTAYTITKKYIKIYLFETLHAAIVEMLPVIRPYTRYLHVSLTVCRRCNTFQHQQLFRVDQPTTKCNFKDGLA